MGGLRIDDLLTRIGVNNIRIQFLHESLSGATKRKRGTVEVKFFTDVVSVDSFMQDEPETIGIVVWVPYRTFREVQTSWKGEQGVSGVPQAPEQQK